MYINMTILKTYKHINLAHISRTNKFEKDAKKSEEDTKNIRKLESTKADTKTEREMEAKTEREMEA